MRFSAAVVCLVAAVSCAQGEQTAGDGGQAGHAGADAGLTGEASPSGMAGTTSTGGTAGVTGTAGSASTGVAGTSAPTGAAGTSAAGGGGPGAAGSVATADGGATTDAAVPPSSGLRVVFPPAGAVSSDTIVVRGTSALASPVGAIRVNGTAATSADGFATFRAVVPLALGDNTLTVTAEGKAGGLLAQAQVAVRRFADDASIQRGAGDPSSAFGLGGFVVDAEEREAIFTDGIYDGLVRFDLRTGNRSLASASESTAKGMVGKGYNDVADPRDVTLDKPGHALLVDSGKLVGVDLATGDRALVSGPTAGTGPTPTLFVGVGFDPAGNRAIALDYEGNALFAIDATSGARSILASATVGKGGFGPLGPIELDLAHHRALTTRAYAMPIIAIDLQTGDRTNFSGEGVGTGPALAEPTRLAVAAARGEVFAWDKTNKRVVAADLATGNRRTVADAATGTGFALALGNLAFGRDLLFGMGGGALIAIDPVEGHRVVLSK